MKTVILAAFIALIWPQAGMTQNVWKCQVNGKTTFSDVPCPLSGQMLEQRQLNSNTIGAVRRQWPEDEQGSRRRSDGYGSSSRSSCPSEQEIKNMETSAGSITLGPKERRFLQDEVRRARQCARGQGNYNQDDWKQIQQAQREQNSINGGAAARARAESIHSAADPYEGDRIAAQRRREQLQRERYRHNAAPHSSPPGLIYKCQGDKCYGTDGFYHRRGDTNKFTSPNGRPCRQIGNRMEC